MAGWEQAWVLDRLGRRYSVQTPSRGVVWRPDTIYDARPRKERRRNLPDPSNTVNDAILMQ